MAVLRENAFCLTSHWCYQTPRCSAATYSAGRPGDVSWFRCLTDCLSFPLFIIPSFRLNNSRPYFFRWVSPPSLNYSGQTDLRRSSSSRTQESVRVWRCLMQRCCFGFALTQTPFFFFLHTFLVMGWVGGLMQEVIRLKNVLKLLKNMFTLTQPRGTTRSRCPQINLCVFLSHSLNEWQRALEITYYRVSFL